jgi:Tfp pilus assembly protein PilZ
LKFKEKRKSIRFPVQLPIDFGQRDHYLSSLCSDISARGLRMETSEDFEVGKKISIFLSFPHRSEPIKLLGKVAWKRPLPQQDIAGHSLSGLGIEFIRPLPEWIRLPGGEEQIGEATGARREYTEGIPRTYVN